MCCFAVYCSWTMRLHRTGLVGKGVVMSLTAVRKKNGLERILREITCPHCWESFLSSDIVWVAQHEELRGDSVLGAEALVRFLPTRFDLNGDAIDSHGMSCQQLACPNCHLVIPRVFLRYPSMIFSLIGSTFSGKSYLLTSTVWELSRRLAKQFALVYRDVDVEGNQTLLDFQKRLFMSTDPDQLVALEKTQLDSDSHYATANLDGQLVLLPHPFLYSLSVRPDHPHADDPNLRGRVLCFYDNAGEHFRPGADQSLTPGTRHMARAKVLMFLYDPTQDSRLRSKCRTFCDDPQLSGKYRTELQTTLLTEAGNRVRQFAHLGPNEKLPQPLLVLLSKSDIWGSLLQEDITTEPYLPGTTSDWPHAVVDCERIRRVSAACRAVLLEYTPDLVAAAEDTSREVLYIPVSSLGCSPELQENGSLAVRPRNIQPHWVTVPIVYSFTAWASGLFNMK